MNPLTHLNEAWPTLLLNNGTLEVSTIIGIGLMWRLTWRMQE